MSFLQALRHRLTVIVRGEKYSRDLADEMRFHLELDAEDDQRAGLSERAARDAARRRFGNVTYLAEEARRQTALPLLDGSVQDLRYAARTFRRSPGFTAAVVLTLALGIGATTAVFSIVDAVLFRSLPYRDADRIVNLWEASDNGGFRLPSYPTFKDWRAAAESWSNAFENVAYARGENTIYVGENGPETFLSASVTPGFFQLLGTRPALGRAFSPDEERQGANRVIVLSWDLWQRRFGGDRTIVGKTITLSGTPNMVIGVMPRGFA